MESDNEHEDEPYLRPAELPKVAFTFLDPNLVPETPAQMARRLACESGGCVGPTAVQYDCSMYFASATGLGFCNASKSLGRMGSARRPFDFDSRFRRITNANLWPRCWRQWKKLFASHRWFSRPTIGSCLGNADARPARMRLPRLIEGETMHARAGLTKNAKFTLEEPSRKLKDKLKKCMGTGSVGVQR